MKSHLVVISWWSNCLGLACLESLAAHLDLERRHVFVVQVGKREEFKERFRARMPRGVTELRYPAGLRAEHAPVIEWVTRRELRVEDSLCFLDHDIILRENAEEWMRQRDVAFEDSCSVLYHRAVGGGASLTSPAFWIAPNALPDDTPSFDMIPSYESPLSAAPYDPANWTSAGSLRTPIQDTLWAARDFLAARNLVSTYRIETLPLHDHFGGLYLLANHQVPEMPAELFRSKVRELLGFLRSGCSAERLADEDVTLLDRVAHFGALIG